MSSGRAAGEGEISLPAKDLELLDPAGNVVVVDIEEDEFPIVSITPRRSGTYTVDVGMAACSAEGRRLRSLISPAAPMPEPVARAPR